MREKDRETERQKIIRIHKRNNYLENEYILIEVYKGA